MADQKDQRRKVMVALPTGEPELGAWLDDVTAVFGTTANAYIVALVRADMEQRGEQVRAAKEQIAKVRAAIPGAAPTAEESGKGHGAKLTGGTVAQETPRRGHEGKATTWQAQNRIVGTRWRTWWTRRRALAACC